MKLIIFNVMVLFLLPFYSFSQARDLKGRVFETLSHAEKPLEFANVYWSGTTSGTMTDKDGKFSLSRMGIKSLKLVVSMLGYKNDTILVEPLQKNLLVELHPADEQLGEVTIKDNREASFINRREAVLTTTITTSGLQRAACCNLSESFENDPSIDVGFTDAVSGAKQIQLLGLAGTYTQLQTENVPSMRGLASSFGLAYIPGSWMESIQISKGTSSVINGYESMTGQINVEYRKPANSSPLFVNLYANSNQRMEINAHSTHQFSDKLSAMVLFHADGSQNKFDRNHDGFMDSPKSTQYNFFNRWDYIDKGRRVSRFGIKYLDETRNGGSMNYFKETFVNDTAAINSGAQPYGVDIKTRRLEGFWKNGIMFADKPNQSLGLVLMGVNHDQTGTYGINTYKGHEKTFYANLIFQSIIGNTNHKFSTGLSYMLDDYREQYNQTLFTYQYQVSGNMDEKSLFTISHYQELNYSLDRREAVPGAFFEYTYSFHEKFSIIGGIRADYHNSFGLFYTPRFHLRYQIFESTILRASAGKGFRTANIIAENTSLLASQRKLNFVEKLKQEEAWNYGINITQDFKLFGTKAQFQADAYRTDFINQVIIDMDSTPLSVQIYNLKGKSYANSYLAQLTFDPVKRLSILMAYRINDVKTTINNRLERRPFVNHYKGLINVSYATKFEKWKFDVTGQFNGSARIPDQSQMPEKLKRASETPEYFILNAQITRKFKNFDVYLGGENLTNFRQKDPITEYFRPYHTHFDTSMVWGPLLGRLIYTGLRFNLN